MDSDWSTLTGHFLSHVNQKKQGRFNVACTAIPKSLPFQYRTMPRRKYGKLQKVVERPPSDNCSRCRAGKHCPIEGHPGYQEGASRHWKGPGEVSKRSNKKNPARR